MSLDHSGHTLATSTPMNLFYSLPDDVMHTIHKKVYSMEVLKQIRHEGDFEYCFGDKYPIERKECEVCYKVIDSIGPEAWKFLEEHMWSDNKKDPMYHKILDGLRKELTFETYSVNMFEMGIANMQLLAIIGWENFVRTVRD
jgi:hypothetical protein